MAKTVELRRAEGYSIAGHIFRKGEAKIVPDDLAALLDTKVDANDIPMFKISVVKKSDIPAPVVPAPVAVLEEEVGMSDAELEALEKAQAAAVLDAASPADPAMVASAAGKIRISKKTAPVGEPTVTV